MGTFLGMFLFWDIAFAKVSAEEVKGVKEAISILEAFLAGISMLLALMTYLVTLFLDPAWLNGTIFGLDIYFKKIWILISNIVYFIFAFLLIWIAFMNIIGKWDEKYQLKQVLPKFIVGVLIVPFSWFIVQFVLSISAVLTVTALSVPFDTFKDFKTVIYEVPVKTDCEISLAWLTGTEEKGTDGKPVVKDVLSCKDSWATLQSVLESDNFSNSIFGLISTYTFGIISFDTANDITTASLWHITTYADLIVKVVIDFLFIVIYAVLILALGLVLFVRATYLWIYTMLSPIFGLMYFLDKKEWGGEWFFGKFNVKEFISLALVPVYAMAALSFGLLFLFVVWNGFGSQVENNSGHSFTQEGNNTTYLIGDKWADNPIQLKITWSIWGASQDGLLKIFTTKSGNTDDPFGIVGRLVIQVFGIIILWGSIMAALRASSVTKMVVEPLHQFGTQVWQLAAKSPGYLPLFGGQSMQSISKAAGTFSGAIQNKAGTQWSKLWEMAAKRFGIDSGWAAQELRMLRMENSKDSLNSQWSMAKYQEEVISKVWNLQNALIASNTNEEFKDAIMHGLGALTDAQQGHLDDAFKEKSTTWFANKLAIFGNSLQWETKAAFENAYGTSANEILSKFKLGNASKVVEWDMSVANGGIQLFKNSAWDIVWDSVKVTRTGQSKWVIHIKDVAWESASEVNVNFSSLNKATKFNTARWEDQKELRRLKDLIHDDTSFDKVMKKLGLSITSSDISSWWSDSDWGDS